MKKLNYLLAMLFMVFAVVSCDYYEQGGSVFRDLDNEGNPIGLLSYDKISLVENWKSGDAAFECGQAGGTCWDFALKVDNWDEDNGMDGEYYYTDDETDITNTITISNSSGSTFDWASIWPVCKVIVKAGTEAFIYNYEGAFGDVQLVAPDGKDISHVTFCFSEPGMCYEEETAWAEGTRYVKKGNWAMYVDYYGVEKTVNLIADYTNYVNAGTVTFSAPVDGKVTITVNLTGGAIFYYDLNDPLYDNNLKVQDYDKAPTKTPSPGLFKWKTNIETGSITGSIVVPVKNFYGVHVDIALPVPCTTP
jgi:hypothetical protein